MTSHRRILPGLTLRARPGRVVRGEPTEVRFTVLDAGDPVRGARVTADGRSGRTDGEGRVTLSIDSRSAVRARATHSGYTPATRRLGVRR